MTLSEIFSRNGIKRDSSMLLTDVKLAVRLSVVYRLSVSNIVLEKL